MLTVSTVSLIEAHPQHRGVVMLTTGVRLKILHLSGDSISTVFAYKSYHVTVIYRTSKSTTTYLS